jgi:lysozyme
MTENLIYGIDVSHNNGTINWPKVKLSDPLISFAYIKATQGVGYKDPANLLNANGAQAAGIKFGYYHFASLNNSVDVANDAISEANWFDQTLKTLPPATLMPVLDIETNEKQLNTQQVQLWIVSFCARMNDLGHKNLMLYSYKPFFDDNLPAIHPFGNIPLWLAQYRNVAAPSLPHGWTNFTVWQFSAKGKVNGISGDCDMNKTTADFLNHAV